MDLERYKNGSQELRQALAGLTAAEIEFKPNPEQWSIHEIVVHLADAEAQGYIRFRTILADTPTTIMNHDQMAWSRMLRYQETSIPDALAIIEVLRKANYTLLANLNAAEWQREGTHSVRGRVTLEGMLQIYTEHVLKHISQIQRNLTAYQHQEK